jgi:hypothetical protein
MAKALLNHWRTTHVVAAAAATTVCVAFIIVAAVVVAVIVVGTIVSIIVASIPLCLQDGVMCQMCGENCEKADAYLLGKKTAKLMKYRCKKCNVLRSRMQRMFSSKEPSHAD